MRKLTLTNHVQSDTTVLENEFIDHYMAEANGEYVKVYLILLRHLNEPSGTLTISKIADLLDITEKDVIRALNYWKKKGLLDYDMPVDGEAPAIPAQPRMTEEPSAPEPAAPSIQPAPPTTDVSSIEQYRSRKEFKELLFVAEQYLGKTLSHSDVESITYFYETLHMSADLIEYLIEYCVENGQTRIFRRLLFPGVNATLRRFLKQKQALWHTIRTAILFSELSALKDALLHRLRWNTSSAGLPNMGSLWI